MLPGEEPIDLWSPLDRKITRGHGQNLRLAPSWVPASELRRLNAYIFRKALTSNVGYRFLPGGPERNRAHREYGDPALYVARMVAALRGDQQTITVDGADVDALAGPKLPPIPEPTPPTGDPALDSIYAEIHKTRLEAWTAEATETVEAWKADLEQAPALRARQTALREWADKHSLFLTMQEVEEDAVSLADGIIVLWPQRGDWPIIQGHDPGTYFPQIPDNGDMVLFPGGIHIAWEYEETVAGRTERFVRRLTWEIVDLTAEATIIGPDGVPTWVGPDGVPLPPGELLVRRYQDTVSQDGFITRVLPWHQEGDPPATTTCVFSDGSWPLKDVQAGDPFALNAGAAQWTVDRYDLGFDFIPVIHRPNTATGREHYGRALCDLAVRTFDDLAMIDTLGMKAAQFLGKPAVWANGVEVGSDAVVIPGHIHGLGANGTMHTLDLSSGLEQLMKLGDSLGDRIGASLGIGELVGRARAEGGAESGIRKLLELAPAISVVGNLRAVREPKDRLLLKMAQRMAQVAGALGPGPTPVARIRYGAFLPTDQAQVMEAVAKGLDSGTLSTLTAVNMLVAAGLPIDDAQDEVERIYSEDTEGAKNIADALSDEGAAAKRLGIQLDQPAAPPVIDLGG